MPRTSLIAASLVASSLFRAVGGHAAPGPPRGLLCELLSHPELAVVTDPRPEFGWIVNDPRRGAVQTACRIVVASDRAEVLAGRGDAWDSGKVVSAQSISVAYAGNPLEPGADYWWAVRAWDGEGVASPFSLPQRFRTGDFAARRSWPGESRWVKLPGEPVRWALEDRHPLEFHEIAPARIVRKAPGRYFIDFGRAAFGTVKLTLTTGPEYLAGRAEVVPSDPVRLEKWLWHPKAKRDGAAVFFRRELELEDPAARIVVEITADDTYALYLDGTRLGGDDDWRTIERYELGPKTRLGEGSSVLAVEARNARHSCGLACGVRVHYRSGKTRTLPADGWLCSERAGEGWRSAGFDATGWVAPEVVAGYGAAPWREQASQPGRDDGRGGPGVELHLGEKLSGDDTVDRRPGGSVRHRKLVILPREGTHTYTATLPRYGRGIRLPPHLGEVMPFRYCEVVNSPSELDPSHVRQAALFYPFDDGASDFTSSDQTLNDVWALCKYSIQATTAFGVYVDGDRERKPYEADAYINQLGHYCVDREYALGRYTHEYLVHHPTWPTEWILHSVLMAWADYMYAGDAESLERCYDDLKAKTLVALTRADEPDDGLVSTRTGKLTGEVQKAIHFRGKLRDIVDWPSGERDGYEFRDVNTVVNAFHYRALVLISRIAEALGKRRDADDLRGRAELVRESFNEKLFDPARGVYVDGQGSRHASLHANMLPLAMGLVPLERKRSVVEFVKGRGMACSVYGAQYLLEALYDAGEAEHALRLMTDRASDRSWPHMIYDVGTTITLEAWDRRYKGNLDWNHAWGAAPANIIPRKLMGIEPLAPGFARIRIRPRPGPLDRASIRMPTVRGAVEVEYRKAGRSGLELAVTVPANASAEVHVPTGDASRVTEGGRPAEAAPGVAFVRYEGCAAVFRVPAGTFAFAVPDMP